MRLDDNVNSFHAAIYNICSQIYTIEIKKVRLLMFASLTSIYEVRHNLMNFWDFVEILDLMFILRP